MQRTNFSNVISDFESLCFLAPDFSLSQGLMPRVEMLSSFWTPCIFKAGTNKASKSLGQSENLDLNSSKVIQEAYISQPWETGIIYRLTQNTWLDIFCVSWYKGVWCDCMYYTKAGTPRI